jgi:hypothetical protein
MKPYKSLDKVITLYETLNIQGENRIESSINFHLFPRTYLTLVQKNASIGECSMFEKNYC